LCGSPEQIFSREEFPDWCCSYYLQRSAEGETVQAFPDGLRMLTGNPFARSNAGNPESKAISWNWLVYTPAHYNTWSINGGD
jgi:hypothetical protein